MILSRVFIKKLSYIFTMKTLCFWLVWFLALFAFSSAFPNVCKYKGRQMTPGQQHIDCFTKATCMEGGILKRERSCPRYSCFPKSKVEGYKRFNPKEHYPHCCGGEICDEKYKLYW